MRYFGTVNTDVGIVKKVNQDSACLKVAEFEGIGQAAMMLVCDGMGGLVKGELASATLIRRFSHWFENELPKCISDFSPQKTAQEWTRIIREENHRIIQYSKQGDCNQMGTTVCGILIVNNTYLTVNVGDSRIYEISQGVHLLTEDQTFINREIKAGRMTAEEAAVHPKRNMLLQCVGASREVNPEYGYGTAMPNTVFMACSDGFRHVLNENDFYENFNPVNLTDIEAMNSNSRFLIETVKKRNERDNITVALLKSVM